MNKNLKLILTLVAVLCMLFAVTAVAEEATTECKHVWKDVEVVREATCTVKGIYNQKCQVEGCGATQYVSRYGHVYEEKIVQATCTEPDMRGMYCAKCEKYDEKGLQTIAGSSALGHIWKETYVDASCESAAGLKKYCSRPGCDAVEYVPYAEDHELYAPQLDHKYETINVAATCKDTGIKGKVACSVCGNVQTAGTVLPVDANAHVAVPKPGAVAVREATCTTDGIIAMVCSVEGCGKDAGYGIIPAGHVWVLDRTYEAATCDKPGLVDRHCKNCTVKELKAVVPATEDHKWTTQATPTCLLPSVSGEVCKNCGTLKKGSYVAIEALGHVLNTSKYVEATCTQPAGMECTCKAENCDLKGKTYFVAFEEGHPLYAPAYGHEEDTVEGKAANCHEKGLTDGVYCKICGTDETGAVKSWLVKPEEIAIDEDAHVAGTKEIVREASCKDGVNGVEELHCVVVTGVDAEGNKIYCGEAMGYGVITVDKVHKWEVLANSKVEATCTTEGTQGYECKVCGALKTEKIEKIAHDMVASTAPSCELPKVANGKICKVCGLLSRGAYIEYPALGHNYTTSKYEPATCEKAAGLTWSCGEEGCKKTKFEEFAADHVLYEAALNHPEKFVVAIPAVEVTCLKDGATEGKKCTKCGETIVEPVKVERDLENPAHKAYIAKETDIVRAADCVKGANGVAKMTCKHCGIELGYASYEPTHDYAEVKAEYVAPTCITPGKKVEKCNDCDFILTTPIEVTKTHNYVAADCEDALYFYLDAEGEVKLGADGKGIAAKVCKDCGIVDEGDNGVEFIAKAAGHAWTQGKYQPATCEKGAGVPLTCACGATDFEEFAEDHPLYEKALGHEIITVKAVAATCSTKGSTEATYCLVCGGKQADGSFKYIVKPEEIAIDEDAHVAIVAGEPIREADCKTGTTGVGKMICGVVTGKDAEGNDVICGEELGYQVIPADHTWGALSYAQRKDKDGKVIETEYAAATCAKAGLAWRQCSECEAVEEVEFAATGEHDYQDKAHPATCTEAGFKGIACVKCGKTVGNVVVDTTAPAKGHGKTVDGVWVKDEGTFMDATCTRAACLYFDCEVCKDVYVEFEEGHVLYAAKLEHDPKAVDAVAPTCDDDGTTAGFVCKREGCGVIISGCEKIAADGVSHKAVDTPNTAVRDANCKTGTTGVGKKHCKYCGIDMGYGVIAADHTWCKECTAETCKGKEVPATCSEAGKYTRHCTVCGTVEKDVEIPATGKHLMSAYVPHLATCTTPDFIGKACVDCGAVDGEVEILGPALGHDMVEVFVDANCENAAGFQYTCSRTGCDNAYFVAIEEGNELYAPAKGHTEEVIDEVAATCSKTGTSSWTLCTACGEEVVAPTVLPIVKDAHKSKTFAKTEDGKDNIVRTATCINPGVAYFVCEETGCGVTFLQSYTVEHNYGAEKISADGTYLYKQCQNANCGHINKLMDLVVEEEKPCEHANVEEVAAVAPTCTATGLTAGEKCTDCGEITKKQEEVAKIAHTEEVVAGKPATCTEAGLTEGKKCTVCGETTVAQDEIPATGAAHVEVAVEAKPATCTEAGTTAGTKCDVCKTVLTGCEEIAALGHTEVAGEGKAATCTEAGYEAGTTCSVCGATVTTGAEIPAKGHTYGNGSWSYNADYTKKLYTQTCTACGDKVVEEHAVEM